MKKAEIEKLLKSYELGQTSSKEEADLKKELGDSKEGIGSWFAYLGSRNRSIPASLEQAIWSSIQSKEKKKRRFLLSAMVAAASVVILISLFLITNTLSEKEMSYEDKVAVLDEALAMTSLNTKTTYSKVLYEDEILIIYTESKKEKK